jgi:hypothetical protein
MPVSESIRGAAVMNGLSLDATSYVVPDVRCTISPEYAPIAGMFLAGEFESTGKGDA